MTPQTEVKAEPLTNEEIEDARAELQSHILTLDPSDALVFQRFFATIDARTAALTEERKKRERLERIIFAHAACSKDDCTVLAALAVTIGAPPNPPITEEGK